MDRWNDRGEKSGVEKEGIAPAKDYYDVIVVGGGPAGAAAAAWIAREGRHVALLDRARFPRDKACGEFLTPQTRALFADLGAWDAVSQSGLNALTATVLHAPDGDAVRHTRPHGAPIGYALRRVDLDMVLLSHARATGVQVHEGFAVRGLVRDKNGCIGGVTGQAADGAPISLRARLVIGADGSHSLVARQLGLVRARPRLQRLAVVTHWCDISGPTDTIEMRARGQIVCGMSCVGGKPTFPGEQADRSKQLQSGAPKSQWGNLTLVAPTDLAAEIAGRAGDWVEQTLLMRFPDLAARLAGATREPVVRTVGCFGHVCRTPIADGAMLVGDAATFIDPFTGEGVYFALRGAQLAAEAAIQALRSGDLTMTGLRSYPRARGELVRRYLLCDVVQSVVRTPALLNRAVQRLDRYPRAADHLLSVLGDLRPATAALHPMLVWRLLAPSF